LFVGVGQYANQFVTFLVTEIFNDTLERVLLFQIAVSLGDCSGINRLTRHSVGDAIEELTLGGTEFALVGQSIAVNVELLS